ncbi:hypothetical protein [Pararhodonellum marinum]|uniref:hypothetical protein n=1 Tax=Pararhodonellum marinum TaxID=2755358 RepID=UPI00188DDB8B|nr:hypothetical protein [Pararhodonellum marinum]
MENRSKNNWELQHADGQDHNESNAFQNKANNKEAFPYMTKYQKLKHKVDRLHASWGFDDPKTALG